MTHKLAAKGIIRRPDGKILIIKRAEVDDHKPGVWETVGGGVEAGATPQEALVREIQEEVGLTVEVKEPFNVFTFTKDNGETKTGITFLCEYLGGEVVLSEEHTDFRWIDPFDFKKFESVQSIYREIASYANKFSASHERFVISQKAVMIRDDKCLICEIERRPDTWDLPGGRIDTKEDGETAFRRELLEEIGITKFRTVGVADYDIWHTSYGLAICGIVNLIESEEEIKLSNEHAKFHWVTEEEIQQHKFIWPQMKRMIERGFALARAKKL